MNYLIKPLLVAAFICSSMQLSPSQVRASDHLDAPNLSDGSITGSGQQDIADLYAFRPSDTSTNSALILTVNPFAGNSSPTAFGTNTAYRFEIDNTGDAMSNLTYEATFTDLIGGGQAFNLTLNGAPVSSGVTGITSAVAGGGNVQAGVFDDPFFFDLTGFQNTLNGTGTFTGEDTFAGANVSAIVLEVPSSTLLSDPTDPAIGVWATTSIGDDQVDRVGRPAINTVLVGTDSKQAFNEASPADDFAVFGDEVNGILNDFSDQANADALTPILLPDVLTFDTSSADGFLNGRRLEDDVIDGSLALITNGGITTDGVPVNDAQFNSVFPFLAPAAVPEPSSVLVIALAFGTCAVRRRRKS